MRRILYRAALAFALAALVGTAAFALGQNPPAQRPHAAWQGGPGGRGPMGMFQHLNLTDDQKTKIQTLFEQQRQSHQGEMQKLRDLQQQLKNTIFADGGPGDTSGLQQQIATLQAQFENDRIALEKQVASVLTADQRKQVRDMPGPGFGFGPMGRGRGQGLRHGPGW